MNANNLPNSLPGAVDVIGGNEEKTIEFAIYSTGKHVVCRGFIVIFSEMCLPGKMNGATNKTMRIPEKTMAIEK